MIFLINFLLRVCFSDRMIPLLYFLVSRKFGACYITVQWGEFRIQEAKFFHEVSNVRSTILSNQEQGLVVEIANDVT